MGRFQAIDIGTNSVRSIVVEPTDSGAYRVMDDEKATTQLGTGLDGTCALAERSMAATEDALRAFLGIGRNLGVESVRAVATAAVRMASNGPEFVARLRDELGLDVEVISEDEEGRLVFLSAASNFELTGRCAVIDIGGGSVEVVTSQGSQIEHIVSMALGARVLSERFVDGDPISDRAFKRMKRHVRSTLKQSMSEYLESAQVLIGSGGTLTTLTAMIAARTAARVDDVHGQELERADVMLLLSELSRSTAAVRRKMQGLPPARVDIILAGTLVLAEAMKLLGAGSVFVNARGIREGIVIDSLNRLHGESKRAGGLDAAREFGAKCRFDAQHGEQVASLALSLFDQLQTPLALDPAGRRLLEAAALLHDVGYYIAYDRHHRHTYHLIVHSGIPGFTSRELRRIAAIARYHTKAMPKSRHEAWGALDGADRRVVEPLAAILRLADGLDRGRAGHVTSVHAVAVGGELRLGLEGDGDLSPELFGVAKKRDLFERVFGLAVTAVAGDDGEG